MSQQSPATNQQPHPAGHNRLAGEQSPYLLQHATNPVDWYPWGDEAFATARRLDRPVFLSIGYATCHWCHVMERESFEDPEVAALLNETFISIKVDREERPDIDQVYMSVCQALTGSGGWPLTVIMTPEGQPFFAATYLPRQSRYGRVGMLDLIPRVSRIWATNRDELLQSAERIVAHLQRAAFPADRHTAPGDLAEQAFRVLASQYDHRYGGFGSAPKFPSPHTLLFLLRYGERTATEQAISMADQSLTAMRCGGIYDQVGFGFHRYATDRQWLVPHFEKMLYDQAMLVLAYTEAYRVTGKAGHRQTVQEILTYVSRDLTASDGGLLSAEDADSEGEEGKFYLWTTDELLRVLGPDDAALAIRRWRVVPAGNYRDELQGELTAQSILHLGNLATGDGGALAGDQQSRRLESIRARLLSAREQRVRPLRDDKVLTDWNALMAAAMARAGQVLEQPATVAAAARVVDLIQDRMRDRQGRLLHRYRNGEAAIPAFLDDHVLLTWALLELYRATLEPERLEHALALQEETIARFWDEQRGGFFFTANDSEQLLLRAKESHDGAMPSGSSVALWNLVRLARLTGRQDLQERAEQLLTAVQPELTAMPAAHCHLLDGQQLLADRSVELVVVGDPAAAQTRGLLQAARESSGPEVSLLLIPAGAPGELVRRLAPFTEHHSMINGQATAYLCHDRVCQLPTSDPEQLAAMLAGKATPAMAHEP